MTELLTPQDAEDAYYDAIDEKDLEAMMAIWEESDETLCLLPMMPAQRGTESIRKAWEPLLTGEIRLDMEIKHLVWIEAGELAIHLVEEHVQAPGQQGKQTVYATNIYRKGADGWHILMHQNSPTPPPPGLQMPDIG
ncbi:MAG: nuclear transport factor 2 family protein [Pseudomonadota bacterium]